MLKTFSPCYFAPDGIEADLERRTVSGGTSLSGQEDLVETDGGGRWFAEFARPYLDDKPVAKTWRALSAHLGGGSQPIIVRFGEVGLQPGAGFVETLHSDGTPFDDGTPYEQGINAVTLAADAALRATTLTISIQHLGEPLTGAEDFTIIHPVMLDRPYRVVEITEQTDSTATIVIAPPLREACAAGTILDFDDVRCVMRLDGEMRSPTSFGFAESEGVRFVEHFPGPEGYL